MDCFKRKWKILTHDERTIKTKLLIALCVNLFFAFTLIFYTPIEMFLANIQEFSFSFANTAAIMGITALIYLVLATGLMPLLPGKLFNYALSAVFSFTLCCYVQGNFLNTVTAPLNGAAIEWHMHTKEAFINLLIWFALFSLPFLIHSLFPKAWQRIICLGALFFVIIQSVGLGSLLINADFSAERDTYLSREDLYTVSSDENVIVFLVDYYDNDYVEMVLEDDPDFFKPLNGFTHFTNNISVYKNTLPSLSYLLSAKDWNYDICPLNDFPTKAFEEENFLDDVKATGAKINLYTDTYNIVGRNGMAYADNFSEYCTKDSSGLSPFSLIGSMANYVLYRDMPIMMKAPFWFYSSDINTVAAKPDNKYFISDSTFNTDLKENGVSVEESDQKNFKFIHMMGGHAPHVIDENGNYTGDSEPIQQYKGCFNIIYRYLDEMRKNGTYKDATIIITSDHGACLWRGDYLTSAPTSVLFVKPAGETGELKSSSAPVSQTEFHATILKALGSEESVYSKYGRTYFDVPEDEKRIRYHYYRVEVDHPEDEVLREYKIIGDANNFENWEVTGNVWYY